MAGKKAFATIALCAAISLCRAGAAPGPAVASGKKQTVVFRTAPADARVFEDGVQVAFAKAGNGGRTAVFGPGTHVVSVRAEGYDAKRAGFRVDGRDLVVEVKLERSDSGLVFLGFYPTSRCPKSVEYTPDGRYLVSAPLSGTAVDVFDAVTLRRHATLAVPEAYAKQEGFVEIAFVESLDEMWVSQMQPNVVHVFSLSDFSYLATLPSGGVFPKVLLAHPDGTRVFVANWLSGNVAVIDPRTRKLVSTIATGGIPRGMALSPDGRRLFVADFDRGAVHVVDLATGKVVKTIAGGIAMRHLVTDPASNRLYASDMGRRSVSVFDMDSYAKLGEVTIGGNVNTIKLSPDATRLYVSTRGPNNPVDYTIKGPEFGRLVVVDCVTFRAIDWQWGMNQPTGLAVSPDGRTIVLTDFLDHRLEVYGTAR
ncbi:MAG: YncE family protein [Spirochaetes bacterium]|nr:YncE family protein [Spirochaetota bacterium]